MPGIAYFGQQHRQVGAASQSPHERGREEAGTTVGGGGGWREQTTRRGRERTEQQARTPLRLTRTDGRSGVRMQAGEGEYSQRRYGARGQDLLAETAKEPRTNGLARQDKTRQEENRSNVSSLDDRTRSDRCLFVQDPRRKEEGGTATQAWKDEKRFRVKGERERGSWFSRESSACADVPTGSPRGGAKYLAIRLGA